MSKTTNIYFDFEFIDDGRDIVPISLGMCTSYGKELYIEYEFDPARASDWVRENVLPHLAGGNDDRRMAAPRIRDWVKNACGENKPKFWGYYPSYDWVLLCQHFGTMMQGPTGWPIRPECLMQLAGHLGVERSAFPEQPNDSHNALADAKWNRELHGFLKSRGVD
jgi:hypothetical protein